jgi:signal transduction histidine kinase
MHRNVNRPTRIPTAAPSGAPFVAREWLHDHTLQMLEYIAAGGYREDPDPDHLRDVAARAADELRGRLEGRDRAPRDLVTALADTVAAAQPLAGATQIYLSIGELRHSLSPADVETLAAATLEALNNVRKHAGARHAFVRAAESAGVLEITVDDDGRGFDPDCCPAGIGIGDSIAGRLERAGGTAAFDSAPSGGARVTLRLPLNPATAGTLTFATEVAS